MGPPGLRAWAPSPPKLLPLSHRRAEGASTDREHLLDGTPPGRLRLRRRALLSRRSDRRLGLRRIPDIGRPEELRLARQTRRYGVGTASPGRPVEIPWSRRDLRRPPDARLGRRRIRLRGSDHIGYPFNATPDPGN